MNLVMNAIKFKASRASQREHSKYTAEQARQLACDPEHMHRAYDPESETWVITQPPMLAVSKAAPSEPGPSVITRDYQTIPVPGVMNNPTPSSPVNLTVGEISRMSAEDRNRTFARILAVAGARERMNASKDAGHTLTVSLGIELDYQRDLLARAKRANTAGKSERHSKTAAKRDNRKGYRKMKDGGTARMLPNRRAETFYVDVVAPMVEGYAWVRPVKRGEKLVITQNFEKLEK